MRRAAAWCALVLGLAFAGACSQTDQRRARERADETREKAQTELHKLGSEVKQDAHKLNQELGQTLHRTGTQEASRKLDTAAHEAKVEAQRAGRKLDHAALIARVKAKLAANAGLSTASNVSVDIDGSVVTLSGTVGSADQKQSAISAAERVDGITKVIDNIRVEP